MRMAIVDAQNIVQNVVVVNPQSDWQPPEGMRLEEVADWVNIGDEFSKPKPPEPEPKSEEQRKAERNAMYEKDLALIGLYEAEKKSNPDLTFSDYLDSLEAKKKP